MLPLSCIGNVCYADEFHQTCTVISMLAFCYKNFKDAKIIENFTSLKNLVNEMQSDSIIAFRYENESLLALLARKHLNDSIKISISFENYVKAALLNQGFVVHKIDGNINNKKYKVISKKQNDEPVSINDLKLYEPFSTQDIGTQYYIKSLKNYTLGLDFILDSPNYMQYLKEIDQQIKEIINNFYRLRNTLHFTTSGNLLHIGFDEILTLTQLINFVNNNIIYQHNHLISDFKLKYNSTLYSESNNLLRIFI